jgi:hypothetical protein
MDDPLNSSFQIHVGHSSSLGLSIIDGRGSLFEQEYSNETNSKISISFIFRLGYLILSYWIKHHLN